MCSFKKGRCLGEDGSVGFDPYFVLRVCEEAGRKPSIVVLYGLLGLYEEAVEKALQSDDLTVAKHFAWKPTSTER